MRENYSKYLPFFIFLLLNIIWLNSCRPDPDDDIVVGQAKDEFNTEDQIQIGNVIDALIEDSENDFGILKKSDYQETYLHLNTLLKQITNTPQVQRRKDFNWQVSILHDDDQVNAFMTPGGHLYIYSGMLKFIKGEHELIGMMAHEVAYADSDAIVNQLMNEFGSKDLSKLLSNDDEYKNIAMDVAESMNELVFSTSEIWEADKFCTEIICEFVWDGSGILSLLTRGSKAPIQWLESKPIGDLRLKNLTDLMNVRPSCGTPDSTFYNRYMEKIVDKLPK